MNWPNADCTCVSFCVRCSFQSYIVFNAVGRYCMIWVCHLTASVPSQDQAGDMKHDSISSPGISDQEKEMASSAFEAFKVNNYNLSMRLYPWLFPEVIVDDIMWCFFRLEAMMSPWNTLTAFRSLIKRTTRLQWIKRSLSFIKVGRQQRAPWSRR